jgi:ATP-binding cassette subfamily B protein
MTTDAVDIKIEDLVFGYGETKIIEDLNMHIKKGQKIAIVGENGAGKTTLTKLLLRLYDANEGSISIDGDDIKNINIRSLRYNIGIALQSPSLYNFSVRDNLRIYNPDITDEELIEATRITGLDEILARKSATLDSNIYKDFDKSGVEFSTGEAQILAITRLLTKKFGLLIFDEPSASLDPKHEYRLNKTIMETIKDTSIIVISHRLSLTVGADCIYFLGDKKILEKGTHQELMKLEGKYFEMFNMQAENYLDKK